MKLTPSFFILLAAAAFSPLAASAQTAPATTATPASAAKKPASFSSSDKQYVKKAAEAQLGLLHLSEAGKGQAGAAEPVQKMGEKTVASINESWGELGTIATTRGAELPKTEQTASEKKEIAELKKLPGDKFEKAYLKALAKEAKRSAAVFADGAKNTSDADLRAFFAKWQPKMSTLNDQVAAAETEASKKK